MDDERMAEKIIDPETYYVIWKGDKDYLKHKEEAWEEWKRKNSKKMKGIEREASKLVLKKEIQQLEKIANRTPEEEQELQTKRAELARLEAQIDEQKQPTNWTPWISLGIVFTIIIFLTALLLVDEKKKRNKN